MISSRSMSDAQEPLHAGRAKVDDDVSGSGALLTSTVPTETSPPQISTNSLHAMSSASGIISGSRPFS